MGINHELATAKYPEKIHREKMLEAFRSLGIDPSGVYEANFQGDEITLRVSTYSASGQKTFIPHGTATPCAVVTIPISDSKEQEHD